MPPLDEDVYKQARVIDRKIEALPVEQRAEARSRELKDPELDPRVRRALLDLWGTRSEEEPPSTWNPGDTFLGYVLDSPIGGGGGGEVWKAHKPSDIGVTYVALKFPHEGADDLEQIRREVRLQQMAGDHPNVHPVIEAGREGRHTGIVTMYVPGGSLADLLRERNGEGLPPLQALAYTEDIANALLHNQRSNIVHRDVKPGNILIHPNRASLADYGHARDMSLSNSQRVGGTYLYMPPEYISGREPASRHTDLWGLGAVFWEMLMGRRLRERSVHVDGPPPQLPTSIPPCVRKIVNKLLSEKIKDRYPSAKALLSDIDDARRILEEREGAEDDGTDEALEAARDRIFWRPRISWRSLIGGGRARAASLFMVLVLFALVTWGFRWTAHPSSPPVTIRGTAFSLPAEPTLTPPEDQPELRNLIVTEVNAIISGCQTASVDRREGAFEDLHLAFTIEEYGHVTHINTWAREGVSEGLASCVNRSTRNYRFPRPAEGRTDVDAIFHLFAPASAPRPPMR